MSPAEAGTRFLGAFLLVVVGYSHLLDISHKIDEGIWYMVIAFTGLILAAILLAVGLVLLPARAIRLAWAGTAVLSLGALSGYALSRLVPLPGMADHQGDWINTYGLVSSLAEISLVGLAAFAMRDLTVRGVRHRPTGWPRLASLLAALTAATLVLSVAPSAALAHNGEEDEAAAGAGATQGAEAPAGKAKGADEGSSTEMAAGHGDPLLGEVELGVAMAASMGFLLWAGGTLANRVISPPVERQR